MCSPEGRSHSAITCPTGSGWSAMARSPSTIACTRPSSSLSRSSIAGERPRAAASAMSSALAASSAARSAQIASAAARSAASFCSDGAKASSCRGVPRGPPISCISAPTSTRSSIALSPQIARSSRCTSAARPSWPSSAAIRSEPVPHDDPRLAGIVAREPLGDHRPVRPGDLDRVAAAELAVDRLDAGRQQRLAASERRDGPRVHRHPPARLHPGDPALARHVRVAVRLEPGAGARPAPAPAPAARPRPR